MSNRRQFFDLQQEYNATYDRMERLNERVAQRNDGLTPAEQAEWSRDEAQLESLSRELVLLRSAEQQQALTARPAAHPLASPLTMPEQRAGKPFPGQAFTRYVGALALSKGNLLQACEIAQRWTDMPEIGNVLRAAARLGSTSDTFWLGRAATPVGSTTDPGWAAPLINYQSMATEFIELLRPATIVGRMPALQPVPFNTKIPRQTAGASANWVGEGLSKPVSALTFDSVIVPWAKIAVICVITQELARFSNPAAEMLVRNDLRDTIAQFMDQQFIDPTVAPIANLKPGSITNGVVPIPSTGRTVAAITADLNSMLLALMNALAGRLGAAVWIMSPAAALFLATLRTAQDIFAFPGMSLGGTPGVLGPAPSLMGIPVIVSGNVPVANGLSDIILCDQSQLMVADDGQVTIDASGEASLQMDSAPATPPTPLVSLWQQDLLGIKAERFIYWMRRREGVVQVLSGFPAAAP
jgi:HK97 family phage major capsid protein